jgi:transcriptional regulator with XRE-family HTH domain
MRVQTAADFLGGFCLRVREARKARGLTQAEMAQALGVGPEAYRAYEKRTPLPHFLIERFARITGTEIEFLLTGHRPRRGTGTTPTLPPKK